ncbi:MAG: TIGR01244 family phosphatase [Rhodomicrobium sp.]|nr:TIGR01244 family phosphatase [Rhodomicrobium sp.]
MVNLIQLDDRTFVAGQIYPHEMEEIAAEGIRLIVDNRPDGESPADQPPARAIESEAMRFGLKFAYLPFTAMTLTPAHAAEFMRLMKETDGIVLAFCRSGNRSTMLWAAANVAMGAPLGEVLEKAALAGYDLHPAADYIQSLAMAAADPPR